MCRGEPRGGTPSRTICSMSCAVREELATAVRARFLTACTVRGPNGVAVCTLQICRPGAPTGRQANLRGGGPAGGTPVPPAVPVQSRTEQAPQVGLASPLRDPPLRFACRPVGAPGRKRRKVQTADAVWSSHRTCRCCGLYARVCPLALPSSRPLRHSHPIARLSAGFRPAASSAG